MATMPRAQIEGAGAIEMSRYLAAIAAQVIRKHAKSGRSNPASHVAGTRPDTPSRQGSTWSAVAHYAERLPDGQRKVVDLRLRHGMCYKEIAANLGIPIGTVRSRLFRGRELIGAVITSELTSDQRSGLAASSTTEHDIKNATSGSATPPTLPNRIFNDAQ